MTDGTRHAWVLGLPRGDTGTWVARCLDLDVSADGPTFWDALDAVEAAVERVLESDAKRGREPFDRPRAPRAEWERLWAVVMEGVLVTEEDLALSSSPLETIATQLAIDLSRASRVRRAPAALVSAATWRARG